LNVLDHREIRNIGRLAGRADPIYTIDDHCEEVIDWDHSQLGRLEPPVSRFSALSPCIKMHREGPP
jgi:hypothetical protein